MIHLGHIWAIRMEMKIVMNDEVCESTEEIGMLLYDTGTLLTSSDLLADKHQDRKRTVGARFPLISSD